MRRDLQFQVGKVHVAEVGGKNSSLQTFQTKP